MQDDQLAEKVVFVSHGRRAPAAGAELDSTRDERSSDK